jgi:hypothetical protein
MKIKSTPRIKNPQIINSKKIQTKLPTKGNNPEVKINTFIVMKLPLITRGVAPKIIMDIISNMDKTTIPKPNRTSHLSITALSISFTS